MPRQICRIFWHKSVVSDDRVVKEHGCRHHCGLAICNVQAAEKVLAKSTFYLFKHFVAYST